MSIYRTERLILRQWQQSDYEPFARMSADPVTMRYFPDILTRHESRIFADKVRALIDTRGWGLWALEIPHQAPFIGFVGLHTPMTELHFCPCVEIGWRLDKEYWGNGYASEAARFALRFGFTELNLDEIVSFTAVLNKPSQAVMARIGMRYAEDFEHPSILPGDPLRPHVLYRLSGEDWQNNSAK